jgi:hypothetical protein
MGKCLVCEHWQPRLAPKGMAALGFAPCIKRSISHGHTFSAHTTCEQFTQADDDTAKAREDYMRRKVEAEQRLYFIK